MQYTNVLGLWVGLRPDVSFDDGGCEQVICMLLAELINSFLARQTCLKPTLLDSGLSLASISVVVAAAEVECRLLVQHVVGSYRHHRQLGSPDTDFGSLTSPLTTQAQLPIVVQPGLDIFVGHLLWRCQRLIKQLKRV